MHIYAFTFLCLLIKTYIYLIFRFENLHFFEKIFRKLLTFTVQRVIIYGVIIIHSGKSNKNSYPELQRKE